MGPCSFKLNIEFHLYIQPYLGFWSIYITILTFRNLRNIIRQVHFGQLLLDQGIFSNFGYVQAEDLNVSQVENKLGHDAGGTHFVFSPISSDMMLGHVLCFYLWQCPLAEMVSQAHSQWGAGVVTHLQICQKVPF